MLGLSERGDPQMVHAADDLPKTDMSMKDTLVYTLEYNLRGLEHPCSAYMRC